MICGGKGLTPEKEKYVIYAAYGSNLLKERFMVYIQGGTYKGYPYAGSKDKTEPIDLGWGFIPHRLYFAKKSSRWDNKGVAFVSCEKESNEDYHTVVRLWRVSLTQLEDILKQEGKGGYNVKLYLGNIKNIKLGELHHKIKGDLDICTFTGCWEKEGRGPSDKYLDIIKRGLKETTNWSDKEIEEYFAKRLPKL